jgi:hypothetical protein
MRFSNSQMMQHLSTVTHELQGAAYLDTPGNYGKDPITPHQEAILTRAQSHGVLIRRAPFRRGLVGCDAGGDGRPLMDRWVAAVRPLSPQAGYVPVAFAMTATALMLSTSSYMVVAGNNKPIAVRTADPRQYRVIRFRGSFGGSELFRSNNPCSVQAIVLDADSRTLHQQMDKANSEYNITHVEYDHMEWAGVTLRDVATYRKIRVWCSVEHKPLVVDEVLSFLVFGPLAYLRALGDGENIAHPDFVLIGKNGGIAAMLCTDEARHTLGLSDLEFTKFLHQIRGARTVVAEGSALLRSTLLLEWYVQNNIAERAVLLSNEFPQILAAAGLPIPPMGGGFLWKFTEGQLAQMSDTSGLRRRLDYQGRLRLYLDWDLNSVREQAQAWAEDIAISNHEQTEECVVTEIVSDRPVNGGGTEFLVTWQRYDMMPSWHPETVVAGCAAYDVYQASKRARVPRRSTRLSN